ncbi:type IV secretion system DNA-binding domain-containing protein [Acidipila rosea]|uniref:Type IV secretion system coupling TraD/TrwB family protein n=1 Tax=Acidipila rosea TaxID=768535 RepID=A0A4R1L5N9_9BACT|nr:type IV secretion system DNA-binding domain-containing protein [Acidipila rosea]TCK73445.1 type IV secretion system coupling TraD/TrwB family protein [Acidipila rosea]
MATQWGRKETIIWPLHVPLMSYCAIAGAFLLTLFFAWERYAVQFPPLQKAYMTDYVRAAVGSTFHAHGSYRLLYLGGLEAKPRLALPIDFAEGEMRLPDGKQMPFALAALAQAQGYRFPFRGPVAKLADASMYRWLRDVIFDRKSPWQMFVVNFLEGGLCLALLLALAVPRDIRRFKEMKYGRVLRGPRMLDPTEFNNAQKGDGLGFKTTESGRMMRIPLHKEAQHLQLMGDTGVGKTQLIMQCLRQIRGRGDSAIVYDPACEYIQRFYDAKRGDIVLNPLDARCPYWGPAQELESEDEAYAIATSLYAPKTDKVDEFFHETPAQIFAHLLKRGPTPHQLAAWMSSDTELMKMVDGTEMAFYIDRKAGPQRAGVLSSLGLVAKSFRMLPERDEKRAVWNARTWSKTRQGWIFITSRPPERDTLRPLHSLWIDLLVMRLLTAPQPDQKPVWFVIDELASLQRLPQLHTAITENRKSKNPLILGFQGKAQLEVIYGHLAEVMLSQPATKIFMKTAEPKAAEWISEAIGKVEIERLKETKFDGTRSGHNFTVERQIEPLVMGSEISGLDDRHAYLKLGNSVARFAFDYMDLPTPTPGFLARKTAGGLRFNPDTLEQNQSPSISEHESPEQEDTPPATESDGPHDKERVPIAWPTPAAVQQAQELIPTPSENDELEEEQALGPDLIRET